MQARPKDRLRETGEEHPRQRPLLVISILPSLATLGNLICGFLAIFCCLLAVRADYAPELVKAVTFKGFGGFIQHMFPTYVTVGCYLIVAAMIFDALDGRLARLARRTTEFGAQLDSIADVVSFGAAPAMLFLTMFLLLKSPPDAADPLVGNAQWRIGLLCALVFVSCAAIRLARYNAENLSDESAAQKFNGLPSPGAAAAFASLLMLHEQFAREPLLYGGVDWASVLRWSIGPVAFLLGMLMVSRLDYVHVFNVYFRRERPLWHLIWLVIAVGIAWFSAEILLAIGAFAYVVSGLTLNWKRRRQRLAESAAAALLRGRTGHGNGGAAPAREATHHGREGQAGE